MTWLKRIFILLCLLASAEFLYGGEKEENLIRSVLNQVEIIAQKSKTLDEFGKQTLTQSATILDLKESSESVLLKTVAQSNKDWKVRFWVVDILGYVGNSETETVLLKIIGNEKEKSLIRIKSLESLMEINKKSGKEHSKNLKSNLRKISKKTRSRTVKMKIKKAVLQLNQPRITP